MNIRTQIEGTWNLVVGTPRGDLPVTLRLAADGAAVSGKAKAGRLPMTVPLSGTREAA